MGLDYMNFLSQVETVEKERESCQNIKTTLIVKLSHQKKQEFLYLFPCIGIKVTLCQDFNVKPCKL